MSFSLSSLFTFVAGLATVSGAPDLSQYALTDTGSINGGNTFPGVSRPMGMVKLGPDLYSGTDAYSGYLPDGKFIGFTMLHESGTGGAPKYGVVSQMPVVGDLANPLSDQVNDTRAEPDHTEVGYYRAMLGSGTKLEMAASTRSGMYKYTFPEGSDGQNHVLVDVSHVLSSYRGQGLGQNFLNGKIEVSEDDGTLSYTGYGSYDNGWNRAGPWTVYFCGYFDKPGTYQTFIGKDKRTDQLSEMGDKPGYESEDARLGALFTFQDTEVTSRVGVSFISSKRACENVNREIPEDEDFATVVQDTKDVWNDEVFSKVTTTDKNDKKLKQLYTAMYFMHLLPTNKTGENPLWKSGEPYYDDIFTFWDTHRCTTALLHILSPEHYEGLLRSMVDVFKNVGWVSDGRSSLHNGAVQAGSNSDNIFADAYAKGVRGDVDWEGAFESMVNNAEEVPPNNFDPRDPSASTKEGRGALADWLKYGFITTSSTRSVTRAVEYSVNDFSLAVVANGLGKEKEFKRYLKRSANWQRHWNPDMQALGFSGFLGPRTPNGFVEQDPLSCGGCYWADHYYQALPWEYSFNAYHDVNKIVNLTGGKKNFIARLEKTFEPGVFNGNQQFGNTLFNPGNEPSFNTPFLYNYVNRQDLTVKRSRYIAKSYYSTTPGGLPGNSDAGAMESWLLWNMIGLYPMTGQPIFLIGSPWFSDLTIDLGNGKELEMTAQGGSEDAFYVQSLKVNGKSWNRSWLTWQDIFAEGGKMEFVLGKKPKQWTTGDLPPSPGGLKTTEASEMLSNLEKGKI